MNASCVHLLSSSFVAGKKLRMASKFKYISVIYRRRIGQNDIQSSVVFMDVTSSGVCELRLRNEERKAKKRAYDKLYYERKKAAKAQRRHTLSVRESAELELERQRRNDVLKVKKTTYNKLYYARKKAEKARQRQQTTPVSNSYSFIQYSRDPPKWIQNLSL